MFLLPLGRSKASFLCFVCCATESCIFSRRPPIAPMGRVSKTLCPFTIFRRCIFICYTPNNIDCDKVSRTMASISQRLFFPKKSHQAQSQNQSGFTKTRRLRTKPTQTRAIQASRVSPTAAPSAELSLAEWESWRVKWGRRNFN